MKLTEDDPETHVTPESLLSALSRTHKVTALPVSRMTSLGKCLCVADGKGGFVSVPLCVPMRSGVKKLGAEGPEVCVMHDIVHRLWMAYGCGVYLYLGVKPERTTQHARVVGYPRDGAGFLLV